MSDSRGPRAEGAEFASHKTHISEVNVAIYDVGNEIAGEFGAQQVSGGQQGEQVIAFRMSQRVRPLRCETAFPVLGIQNSFQRGPHLQA